MRNKLAKYRVVLTTKNSAISKLTSRVRALQVIEKENIEP